ncbi:MAG: glycosyltransferase family 9 protein [Planctomycetota bacterium]
MTTPQATTSPPARALIVKPSSLGDVITAVPVLRGLRRSFPRAHLAWLLDERFADVIAHDSDLDEAIIYQRPWLTEPRQLSKLLKRLRAEKFDWTIDLQGLMRSAMLTLATGAPLRAGWVSPREPLSRPAYNRHIRPTAEHVVDQNIQLTRSLGIDARGEDFTLEVSSRGGESASRICSEWKLSYGQFVAAVPPTRWATKQYPVRHWRKVVAELARSRPVVILGSPSRSERELCAAIAADQSPRVSDLCGSTTVDEMVGMIAASGAVVCADSAAQYIAPAVGVPVVSIAGPTRPRRTGPYRLGRTVAADVPCRGCLRRSCDHTSCMQLIDPKRIVRAVEEMAAANRAL